MSHLTWKGARVVFGGIFSLVVFGGVFSASNTAQACTDVCISNVCPDGTGFVSCCNNSAPGPGACSCTPDPLPACPTPPPCNSSMGVDCSSSAGVNACGMYGNGTIQCDGSCDAVAPPDSLCPSCVSSQGNACTGAANSCGMTYGGVIQCNGSCDAGVPSEALCITSHTITATAGPGGSISPVGSVSVASNMNQGFTITPDPGYQIDSVRVDGSDKGTPSTYMFNNVISDSTIDARFKAICGDGIVLAGEQCDMGALNGVCPASCSSTCTTNSCPPPPVFTLKICEQTAIGWVDRAATGALTPLVLGGPSVNLKAVYDTNSDCSGVAAGATWVESGFNAVSLTPSGNARSASPVAQGSETLSVTVGSVTKTVTASVTCVQTASCSSASSQATAANTCTGSQFTISDSCGSYQCPGTRSCSYNWREVAP